MPQDASCPKCKAAFPVTEARNAFTVACPKCDTEMTVEFKKPAVPPEAGQPPYNLLVKPGALAAAPVPPKKKKDDEDDDPKRRGGSAMIVLLSGGMGLMFVLGGLGLTAWFLFFFVDTTPSVAANNSNRPNNNQPNNPNRNNPTPNNPNKGNNNPGPGPGPVVPPKPKDTFELKPVRGVQPLISPPALPDTVSYVELGSRVGTVAVGGGGRYIVMHFPDKGQLSVFDVNAARITATVPADNGDVQLTAGLSKVVLFASGNIFRVYNLPDLSKQYDHSAPGGVVGIAMGCKTNGPLLLVKVFGDVALWDIGDSGMKEVEGSTIKPIPEVHSDQRCARASPDGTAFSTHDRFHANNKTVLLTEQNRRWKTSPDTYAAPFPGADGNFYGNGVVVNKAYQEQRFGGIGAGSNTWFLPSVSHRDYFLKLTPQTVGTGVKAKKVLTVSIHKSRNSELPAPGTTVLSEQPEFEGFLDRFGIAHQPAVVYDQHLFLIPEAKVLITLNAKKDRLVLRKLDIK